MPSVFTRIIGGELPARFVWKDDRCVAFLSVAPITHGHTLVVPREEIDHWIDLDPDLNAHLMRVAHAIGQAQQSAFHRTRIGLMIAGLEVPHMHLHVLPIDGVRDLDFTNADHHARPEALDAAAASIRDQLRAMGCTEAAD